MDFEIELNDGADRADGTEAVGDYFVPMDPMDLLQCDSCQ